MSNTIEASLEEIKSKTFELVDQRNSGFQLKGTENTQNPICLRSSKLNLITVTSEMCLGKGKGYAKIQWVPNAPVIHVEDMYVDPKGGLHSKAEKKQEGWEESKGLKSLGYNLEREMAVAKEIKVGFQFGLLNAGNYGDDPSLIHYLMNHHCNVDRPNAEHDKKDHAGLFKFRCVQQDKKAEEQLEDIDSELSASEYVSSLRTKKADKFVYSAINKAKIDATLRMLDINPGCHPEEYATKHFMIKQYADANPAQFMSFIEDTLGQYKVEIGKAISYKVLEMDKKGKEAVIFTEDANKQRSKKTIYTFESSDTDGQIEELTMHFINDSGIIDYKNMQVLTGLATSKN